MLIITADDFGLDKKTTNSILSTSKAKRITSISAMVFMADSIRAADIAMDNDVEIGLHLNFTLNFSGKNLPQKLTYHQNIISRFLLSTKFTHIFYNPLLRNSFEYVIRSHEDEFLRLYKKSPIFYNGHHHMHLCANIIFDNLLPRQIPIRRTFTFNWGEKDPINIIYRKMLDYYISRRYISTDAFYSLSPLKDLCKIKKIIYLSRVKNIELMVHPNRKDEFEFLQSSEYIRMICSAKLGGFSLINHTKEN